MFLYRNRVINGDFRIDQRNSGYATTVAGTMYNSGGFGVDKWKSLNTYPGVTINHDQTTLS